MQLVHLQVRGAVGKTVRDDELKPILKTFLGSTFQHPFEGTGMIFHLIQRWCGCFLQGRIPACLVQPL